MQSQEVDICIVSASLLETGTVRGGGCEVTDYNVALQLSSCFNVVILSTFYQKYIGTIKINDHFYIKHVFFPAPKDYPPKSVFKSVKILLLTYIFSFLVAINIIKFKKKGLKVIIVHNPQTSILSVFLAKLMKIKIIYAEGNTTPWTDPYIVPIKLTTLEKGFHYYNLYFSIFICKLADRVRTQSNSIKNGMIKHGINPKKIKVIKAGVETSLFKPSQYPSERTNDILFVGFIGRLSEIKGVNLLLEIVRRSVQELPNVKFLIFGEGPYKPYFQDLPNVIHLGLVPRNELNSFLSGVHVTLFFQKELGRAEIEAMSSGKVIIAARMGEMPEVIQHLENGILCNPDSESYINALKCISRNPSLRSKISKNARRTITKSFTWKHIGDQWIPFCMDLMAL